MSSRFLLVWMGSVFLGAAGQAAAASIAVLNATFETPALSGAGQFTNAAIPNWVGGGFRGVFWPVVPSDVASVPDGNQVAYIFGAGTISQDLGVAVQAGVTYELDVWVGLQGGLPGSYLVRLLDGGSTVIASSSATLSIPGTFVPVSISGVGSGIGNLIVELNSTGGQPLFDFVQVQSSASSAPEPAPISSLILGLVAVGFLWRLRPIAGTARRVPVPNRVSR